MDYPNRKHGSYSSLNVIQTDDFESEAYKMCVSSSKCIDVSIFYSGYSYHMSLHQKWFTIFKLYDFGFVYLGNDTTYTIIGMGQLKIAKEDGVMWTLSDVRYIPESRKNLISLDTLQENGFSYMSDGYKDIMKISDRENSKCTILSM